MTDSPAGIAHTAIRRANQFGGEILHKEFNGRGFQAGIVWFIEQWCLIIRPRGRKDSLNWCIPRDKAALYLSPTGSPSYDAFHGATEWLVDAGIEPTQPHIHAVVDLIVTAWPHWYNCPTLPALPAEQTTVGLLAQVQDQSGNVLSSREV